MTLTLDWTSRSFPPEPVSARDARRFLRGYLQQHARDDLLDAAQTALSEVVTNAVLHAHTDVEVALALPQDGSLRVEVRDRNPQLPAQRGYGTEATTGRGMQLIAALTADCGVRSSGALGKAVWFVVRGDDAVDPERASWERAGPAVPLSNDGDASVLLLGLPPTLWLAARQHHDAVLRELVLHAQAHPDDAPSPERFAQADRARGTVSVAVVAALDREDRTDRRAAGLPAGRSGPLAAAIPPFDLSVQVPADAAEAYAALQDVLDAAERLAASGALLARPGLPEIVAVRDWVCEQVIAQLAGVLPSAWRGPRDDQGAAERREPVPADWDLDAITGERNAVAADDANRILAVSPALAEALGWAAEDLVGRRVVALVPPELREAHVAGFSRHVTTGEAHVLGVPLRLPVLRADGSRVVCDLRIDQHPSTTGGRRLYVARVEPVAPLDER